MPLFNFLAPEVTIILSGKFFSCRLYFQQVWCWWPHLHTKQLAHNLVSLTSSALVMAAEDVYNLDKIVIFYRAQPSKTLVQGIICGCKIQKDHLTLAFVVKATCTNKVETCDYIYSTPKMLWKVVANKVCLLVANQIAWMTSYVFESWMMSLNVHFKFQKWEVLLNMDRDATHPFKHVGRHESFGFSTLQLSNNIITFYHLILQVWYNPWIR